MKIQELILKMPIYFYRKCLVNVLFERVFSTLTIRVNGLILRVDGTKEDRDVASPCPRDGSSCPMIFGIPGVGIVPISLYL